MNLANEDRTEKATPKRRREQRKEGRVAQSSDIVMVGSLLILFLSFKVVGPYCFSIIKKFLTKTIESLDMLSRSELSNGKSVLINSEMVFFAIILPITLLASISAIILTGVQTKFLFSSKSFAFRFSNIDFFSGIKKVFSLKSFVKLIASMVKIVIVGNLLYKNYLTASERFAKLLNTELIVSGIFISKEIIRIALNLCLALVGIAAIDYFYNWWSFEKSIKMTKQEVKEEYKQMEGNPQIKSRIRQRQRQFAQRRMMQMVPKADVVIRNPNHIAVAVKYTPGKNSAPKVIAKGLDKIALKIVKTAEQNDVPVVEDRPLARELYSKVKIGHQIPASLYRAIAEILVWVYKLRKNKEEQIQ